MNDSETKTRALFVDRKTLASLEIPDLRSRRSIEGIQKVKGISQDELTEYQWQDGPATEKVT